MVDAIISTVLGDLTSMVLSSIKEEVKLVTGVNDEVKNLVSNFKSIQALLDDAEEQQVKEASVKNWLFDLKTVSYDMDDVLDEWKAWIHRSQLDLQHQSSDPNPNPLKDKVLSFFSCVCFTANDISLRHVVAGRIKEIQQRLDAIATDKVRYQLNSTEKTEKHIKRHVTTSFIGSQVVKGRHEEKDKVKSMILDAKSKLHTISIVGMGGIGKTTLAKLIYNDSEIQNHFDKKMWVCVSHPFDAMRVAKAILESLDDSSVHDFKELENVLKKIREILEEKRFLLVLDDVWNESRNEWVELEHSLNCGLLGSTLLVTTRKVSVASVMGCKDESIHRVGTLSWEQCWSIISEIALVEEEREKLETIGKRIANKCNGLPLTATAIGGLLLFKKTEKEWLRVLERKEWEGDDILDPLKLSYYDLPLPLKSCFSYCAIFPKGQPIAKSRLIGMWMGQGYLRGKEEDEDLEMIGETYFKNLVARSLFQTSPNNDVNCTLHDMVSDLAQEFTKNECSVMEFLNDIEPAQSSVSADLRHLTTVIAKGVPFPNFVYSLKKLRTLVIEFLNFNSSLSVVALEGIFNSLTCLRTLDLSRCDVREVPSSIGRLVHLRWLDLSGNFKLQKLPESLCECYYLQTLILLNCVDLVELPQRIGQLVNLMYLKISGCSKIKYLPKGIGNLWRLKELHDFYLSVHEVEASAADIGKLNNLRGTLYIHRLRNIRKIEEVRAAQLKKKKNISHLGLDFEGEGDHQLEDEQELLEALEPPSDVEMLNIINYGGNKLFPSWIMKLSLLKDLTIYNCKNCKELPPLGRLPCLEVLTLRDMKVQRVGVEFMGIEDEEEEDPSKSFVAFPRLKKLYFFDFLAWEVWDDEWLMKRINKDDQQKNTTMTVMPCLEKLQTYNCPRLKTFPYYLLSPSITGLQQLDITNCHVLQQQIDKHKLSHIPHVSIGNKVRGLGNLARHIIRTSLQ